MPSSVVEPLKRTLPHGHIAFQRERLSDDVAIFAREYLTQKGELRSAPGMLERRAVRRLARRAEPEIARLVGRYGDNLDVRVAARVIDRTKFQMASRTSNRRAWLVSGGVFFGALAGFAAAGYGINLGIADIFSHETAERVRAGWNPIWYTVGGALVGACTALFIDKVTSPTRALINRTGFRGAPVQPQDIGSITQEMIFSAQLENVVDGRFNVGRWVLTIYEILTSPAFAVAGEEMRAARLAGDPRQKQAAIELAGMFVARRLINSELYWFPFDPANVDMFDNLRLTLGAHFVLSSPDEITAFHNAVLDEVRRERKNVDSQGRPSTEEAIKNYYTPFLERILERRATQPMLRTVEQRVAHAG